MPPRPAQIPQRPQAEPDRQQRKEYLAKSDVLRKFVDRREKPDGMMEQELTVVGFDLFSEQTGAGLHAQGDQQPDDALPIMTSSGERAAINDSLIPVRIRRRDDYRGPHGHAYFQWKTHKGTSFKGFQQEVGVASGELGKREKRSHFIFPTPYFLLSAPLHAKTASTSISISMRSSIRRRTSTIVAQGLISPKNSPWARPYSSQREMSVTNIRVLTTSFKLAPRAASARSMLRIT